MADTTVKIIRDIAALQADLRELKRNQQFAPLHATRSMDVTLSGNAFEVTKPFVHLIPETGSSDDLDRINGGQDGKVVIITTRDSGDTITITPYTMSGGNIDMRGSGNGRVLFDPHDSVFLIYNASTSHWEQIGPDTLNSLIGVVIDTPLDGQLLTYDFALGVWKNMDPAVSGGGGGTGDLNYEYVQGSPSALWTITHSLGKFPSVTVIDSGGSIVIGDVFYIDNNNLTVTFSAGFSGKAYLN